MANKYCIAFAFIAIAAVIISSISLYFSAYHPVTSPVTKGTQPIVRSITVPSSGVLIIGWIGVYNDSACTVKLTSIDWGTLSPGGNRTVPCFIRDEGAMSVVLSLAAANWVPSNATSIMALSWNYTGATLTPKTVIPVNITLDVLVNATGVTNFSFDVVFTGTSV